jgi:AraC family transcriptional regulator of adaptative response/methylated-DNA-[protein]-cysteine methyltransferase
MTDDFRRMAAALAFLTERFVDQPSLAEIAAAVELTPAHFQRLFKRYVGISPKRFCQHLTLQAARAELASGNVLDAALAVGLSGPSRLHDLCVTIEAVTPGDYRRQGEALVIRHGVAESPLGPMFAAQTDRGLCQLDFVDDNAAEYLERLAQRWPRAQLIEDAEASEPVVSRLFRRARSDRPWTLDVVGSNLQIQVWQALTNIPPGRVWSYQQVAELVGRPTAVRAVASAIARNPVAYLIPCHRVLRKTGELSQYRWGPNRKRTLLALERAWLDEEDESVAQPPSSMTPS